MKVSLASAGEEDVLAVISVPVISLLLSSAGSVSGLNSNVSNTSSTDTHGVGVFRITLKHLVSGGGGGDYPFALEQAW